MADDGPDQRARTRTSAPEEHLAAEPIGLPVDVESQLCGLIDEAGREIGLGEWPVRGASWMRLVRPCALIAAWVLVLDDAWLPSREANAHDCCRRSCPA